MNQEYQEKIGELLYMMAEVFRDEVTVPLIDAWAAVLQDEKVTIDEARQAAILVMKSRQYNKLPTPAVFLEILKPQDNSKAIAGEQADEVLEALRGLGPYGLPNFKDPITAELMSRRWPWRSFCMELLTEQVKWWRKDFIEAYCEKKQVAERPLLEAPKPKAIGDGTNPQKSE